MRTYSVVATLLVAICAVSSPALSQTDVVWNGGIGFWNNAANWTPNVIPNDAGGSTYRVLIDDGNGTASFVTLNQSATVSGLVIDAEDTLDVQNGRVFTLAGDVANSGTLMVSSTGGNTYLRSSGTVSFTGGGTVVLSSSAVNWIDGTATLINFDNTFSGAGNFGANALVVDNRGQIVATSATPFVLDPPAATAWLNTGTLRAATDGHLRLNGGAYDNAGGLITADDAAVVELYSGAAVTGGTLSTTGTGEIQAASGTAALADVASTGLLHVLNGRVLDLQGTINNSGTIWVDSTGGNTYLRPSDSAVLLTGGGEVVLSDRTVNWVTAVGSGTLTNVDNTIRGAGRLGNNVLFVDNQAEIVAEGSNRLLCDPPQDMPWLNTGTLRASTGGTLGLDAGTYDNHGGVIAADDGGLVQFYGGAVVTGGTLTTTGSGDIQAAEGTALLVDVVNEGNLHVVNGRLLHLQGSLHNTGTIWLDSSGGNTYLRPDNSDVTLTGGGEIVLSDRLQNSISAVGTASLTNVDNTIRGAGRLGFDSLPVNNQGEIVAEGNNALLCNAPSDMPWVNTGTLRAGTGGTLAFDAGSYDNSGGVIAADDGGVVELLGGATLTGGTLTTTGSGQIQATSGASSISDLTIATAVHVNNGAQLLVDGDIVNQGTIYLDSTGSNTYLRPTVPNTTFTGGGEIVLSDRAQNWIYSTNNSAWTNVDNTIHGAGRLGLNSESIRNDGTIIADANNLLDISPGGSYLFDNRGTLRVTGAGGMRINPGLFTTSGLVEIEAGRVLTRLGDYVQTAGTTRLLGTLNVTSGGALQLEGGELIGTGIVNGPVVNSSSLSPGLSPGTMTIDGNFTNATPGSLVLEINGTTPETRDLLATTGAATLGGTLDVTFSGLTPAMGDRYRVLTYGSRTGFFETILEAGVPAPLKLGVSYQGDGMDVVVVRRGDMNCDGAVTFADIDPFVQALGGPASYYNAWPGCVYENADINRDGRVDFKDIDPFVAVLSGGD